MSADAVTLEVGPVEAGVALEWVTHCRALLARISGHEHELSVQVDAQLVELLDAVLLIWESVASKGGSFQWTYSGDADRLARIVDQWLLVGSLTDADLAVLGTTWAPERTKPMSDAVTAAVARTLEQLGEPGLALRRRLGT